MPQTSATLLERLLERFYRPEGHRLGIVVSGGIPPQEVAAAEAVLRGRGRAPARRLARLQPWPGERVVRSEDVADFLTRYGHEYGVAWLPAHDHERDIACITAAAHASGCAIGWDMTDAPGDAAALMRECGADFALHRPDGDAVAAYVRAE